MDRDLRETALYRKVEEHYRTILGPGFGRITSASDVDPSPDGARVAFAGGKLEKLEGVPTTRICVTDAAGGGGTEEVTAGPNDDRSPRWSPDGSRLAFLSDRVKEGRHQLYLLSSDRIGEARATPEVEGTVEYIAWSPSGRSILLGVAGTGAELAGALGSGSTKKDDEAAPSWLPTVRVPFGEDEWRRAFVHDVQSGETRAVSREGMNVWEAVWCGEGQLAAIVSDSPDESAWYAAPLAMIDVESGKELILHRGESQLDYPAASPSGRRLAVIHALCSDRLVMAGDVLLVDVETGEATKAETASVDVTYASWRSEDHLLVGGLRGLRSVIGEIDARTGSFTELYDTDETWGTFGPVVKPIGSGSAFVGIVQSHQRPPEVAVVEDGDLRTITSLAHAGSEHQRSVGGTEESVSWTAPDGMDIQGLLIRPSGEGPHPLILWVHGGPVGAETSFWWTPLMPLLVSRGYAVLLPNPRGSSGRGQAFAEMVYGDMGGADALDDLAGVDAMVERGVADPTRIGVMGGSYGGFMSAWLPTQDDRFAAAVAISPVTDWYSQHFTSNIGHWDTDILREPPDTPAGQYFNRSPVMFAKNTKTPTLLTAGLRDRCTPAGQAIEFFQALVENGVEAELALYPEEGHGVRKLPTTIDFATRIVGWLDRYLKPNTGA
jgi:dipeptidyl aminopeptidase/acylaminoacyl peptidase